MRLQASASTALAGNLISFKDEIMDVDHSFQLSGSGLELYYDLKVHDDKVERRVVGNNMNTLLDFFDDQANELEDQARKIRSFASKARKAKSIHFD